jgi:hypothetical protein
VYLFSFQVSTYSQKRETVQSVLVSMKSRTAGCIQAKIPQGMCVHFILNILCISVLIGIYIIPMLPNVIIKTSPHLGQNICVYRHFIQSSACERTYSFNKGKNNTHISISKD